MKRIKGHKIKSEKAEASHSRDNEEHDLAYYIHDRVELMHQVFSVLKYKELKAMAPESVRNLPVGDLQELCTEELLGISSKRLLAVLDGCEAPSDTESSSASQSPERLETISLDSISSDEEILSQSSKKKKHKHRKDSKSKSKKKDKDKPKEIKTTDENTEVSKASRAGLTVLELLELQARARAIRAQLQNEQAKKKVETATVEDSEDDDDDDDDVEIKEEAPDVVEISSGDEKPDINKLQAAVQKSSKAKEAANESETLRGKETTKEVPKQREKDPEDEITERNTGNTVTKRVNDLLITVPQAKKTRKIKLNRNKVTTLTVPVTNGAEKNTEKTTTAPQTIVVNNKDQDSSDKKKKKKSKKKKNAEKNGSDEDEITLQLSDSEKMDLLEDLDGKNYQKLSSGSSDSESTSDSEVETSKDPVEDQLDSIDPDTDKISKNTESLNIVSEKIELIVDDSRTETNENKGTNINNVSECNNSDKSNNLQETLTGQITPDAESKSNTQDNKEKENSVSNSDQIIEETNVITETDVALSNPTKTASPNMTKKNTDNSIENNKEEADISPNESPPKSESDIFKASNVYVDKDNKSESEEAEKVVEISKIDDIPLVNDEKITEQGSGDTADEKERKKSISEGELTDRDSSEVEAHDIKPEVVCISDDETIEKKKKKKKDKKAKKSKKSKKIKQDFREGANQNFFKDANTEKLTVSDVDKNDEEATAIDLTDEDVYEILELSDDSSCYEVEGTVLSKEPTVEEIAALSAAIDDIKKEDIEPTPETLSEDTQTKSDESDNEIEQISWKDRYLDSKKVKRVLTTANILNALRKKNKELKKKMDDKKKELAMQEEKALEEGSIEHYQTLQGSTKYVAPAPVIAEEEGQNNGSEDISKEVEIDEAVTREMKKDAKQLLKMYKKLMNNKKVKRREKKKKRKENKKEVANETTED